MGHCRFTFGPPGLLKGSQREATSILTRGGTDFEQADKLFFDQIEAELVRDETLKSQAQANKIDTFKYAFEDQFLSKLIERMDQNQEIFEKIVEDKAFGKLVREWMLKKVYARLQRN